MLWFDKHRQGQARVGWTGEGRHRRRGFRRHEPAKSLSRAPVEVTVIDRPEPSLLPAAAVEAGMVARWV
jgi:hypothetical protein